MKEPLGSLAPCELFNVYDMQVESQRVSGEFMIEVQHDVVLTSTSR
jgi:hypothetical protein